MNILAKMPTAATVIELAIFQKNTGLLKVGNTQSIEEPISDFLIMYLVKRRLEELYGHFHGSNSRRGEERNSNFTYCKITMLIKTEPREN